MASATRLNTLQGQTSNLSFASEAVSSHGAIPFLGAGLSREPEMLIASYLNFEDMVVLAGSEDSSLKDSPAIQKVWRNTFPEQAEATAATIKAAKAKAAEESSTRIRGVICATLTVLAMIGMVVGLVFCAILCMHLFVLLILLAVFVMIPLLLIALMSSLNAWHDPASGFFGL